MSGRGRMIGWGQSRHNVPLSLLADAAWLAALARGSSWPGEVAWHVERAADRVEATFEAALEARNGEAQ